MLSAIEEFQGDVSTHVPEHTVVAHSETILVIVAAGMRAIAGSQVAGIRRNQTRKRKDAVAIVPTACCKGRNYGMAQPPKHAFTLTAVIQCVFVEGFRERIARRRSQRRDAEVGTESLAITLCALTPFRRCPVRLVDARSNSGTDDGIRPERIKEVVAELRCLGRTHVSQIRLRGRCTY